MCVCVPSMVNVGLRGLLMESGFVRAIVVVMVVVIKELTVFLLNLNSHSIINLCTRSSLGV